MAESDSSQPVPVNAMFADDFVTQLVLLEGADTMQTVAGKVAYHVVGRRVPARDKPMFVRFRGNVVPTQTTVAEAGIGPLDEVYVEWADDEKVP